jgi:hypothetical protein
MDKIAAIRAQLDTAWIPVIYRDKVRSQRTRSVKLDVPERYNHAEIQYTLLGIELKVGKRRMSCPDLAAARYLRVFARAGVVEIAIPYDITRVSLIADELETAWHRLLLLAEETGPETWRGARTRLRNQAVRAVRDEINAIGAGLAMPAFDRETRQRIK